MPSMVRRSTRRQSRAAGAALHMLGKWHRKAGNNWGRPDVLRIRGEMLIEKGDEKGAEQCFSSALTMARAISGRAWELRTATSLARLWAA